MWCAARQPVDLTAKEYQLPDMFISQAGKVLSRTRILNKVWSYDSDPLTNVVNVYICHLGTKMNRGSETGWVGTIRSYGYRFDLGCDAQARQ